MAATSSKPRGLKMNGFESWMVENFRFCGSMAKTKLRQELDGQK
jgi:hypothetical protein